MQRLAIAQQRDVQFLADPGQADREVFFRGISWIVESSDEGGVVIALEIPTGAVVAGPFEIARADLEARIGRVLARRPGAAGTTVH